MRNRLIELLESRVDFRSIKISVADHFSKVGIEAIADHLLENGIIAPPCELNDLVYVVPCRENGLKEVEEMRCLGFHIAMDGKNSNLFDWKNKLYQPYFSRFGVDIFLTKKEAEAEFERRKNELH